jgi:hypothetical protein
VEDEVSDPVSLGPSLDAWRMTRWPRSIWRVGARKRIQDVVESIAEADLADKAAVLERVDAAYPFGERKYEPYKCWLKERRLFIAALEGPCAVPTADEAGVCEVAGDLVQLGRVDEARKLLDEQAPNRLGRKCTACGAGPRVPCVSIGTLPRILIVPHLARVGRAGRDVSPGPLFEGAP